MSLSTDDLASSVFLLVVTGGAALAWWRIRQGDLAAAPEAAPLRDVYRLNTLHHAVQQDRIARAVTRVRSAGVEPLLAKGWAAARLYPEPGLRPPGDIDLYVRREQHAAALVALMAAKGEAVSVDLHRGFSDLDDRSPDRLFARSRVVEVKGVEVRVPGPEDHLRLLCLHLLRHGAARAVWLCDIAAAVEARGADFDWDYFLRGRRRHADACACALGLAARLLGARLEGTPLAGRAAKLPSWLAPAALRQWGSGSGWRDSMTGHLQSPSAAFREARRHWPNPIEGTAGVGAPYNELPRLPFQLAFTFLRIARFASDRRWLRPRRPPASPAPPRGD